MINFTPLKDIVLIEPIYTPEAESSLIALPDNIQKSAKSARVLATGPKVRDVKVGDIVLLPDYGAVEVILDEKKYKLVHEEDIQAVLE